MLYSLARQQNEENQGRVANVEGEDDSIFHEYKKMSTHQIWNFVNEAKRKGVSMDKLAKIRSEDRQGGCRIGTVCYWQRKLLALGKTQSQLAIMGARHLSLVTDGSTHSSRNFLVTLFYSCQNGVATFGTSQAIGGSKVLYPNEMNLTMEAERLAARREMERLSALKFMQALQAQLKHVSQNRLSLESFMVDETLLPFLKPHAKRFTEMVNLQTKHYTWSWTMGISLSWHFQIRCMFQS